MGIRRDVPDHLVVVNIDHVGWAFVNFVVFIVKRDVLDHGVVGEVDHDLRDGKRSTLKQKGAPKRFLIPLQRT